MPDVEYNVMGAILSELEKLSDDAAKQRVIDYVTSRLSLRPSVPKPNISGIKSGGVAISTFATVADLFARVQCSAAPEKALVVASYFQEHDGKTDFTGFEVNSVLKHLGHGVANITGALDALINRNPKLVIQLRKEGKTRQAQKKYKVTTEGIAAVNGMLTGNMASS
jgi:hypothetical protein